ncbi:uncharacterized protein [Nicotiana tomentosiformis]|uniref:uncharacterized protein n=1 Tax=Nicotiana tomentosiformis TaxID=4098 RepID=UPI00388C52BD
MVHESSADVYKVICRRWFTGYNWMLRTRKLKTNMWVVGKYIGTHNCEMDTFSGNHFNLNVDLISLVLIPHIEASIRYMPALQYFNPGTVISIDGSNVYGKYDIKLLIAVVVDANESIFPLAFAICANESQKTWILFLNHLKEHVVRQRSDHQECKFRRQMELIRQKDQGAYSWLMRHELDKWTLHAGGGRRWEILTTNVSESFNGLLKSTRGLHVTAMVRMSFKQMAERFVERSRGASSLMEMGVEFMPIPMKRFEKYGKRAQWNSFLQYCNERNIFEVRTTIHHNQGNNTHTINEARRLCSCGKWSIYHISCSNAMKCFQHTGFAATSGQLQSVGAEHYWPSKLFKMVCNKDYVRQRQVQKQMCIRNQMDVGDTVYAHKCGICSQTGHDRRKCPSAGLASGGNSAPDGSSSNVPNYQG